MSTVVHSISENSRLRIARLVQLLVARQRLAALEELRTRLPLDDPDRHAIDSIDAAYCRLTIDKPDAEVITLQRRVALLKAIRKEGGRWKSGRAIRLYEHLGYGVVSQSAAARDLRSLRAAGHLVQHDTKGVRYFTFAKDQKGGLS